MIMETISKCIKDRTVIGSSQHRFMEQKSCLTNLGDQTVSGSAILLFSDSVNLLNNNGEEFVHRSHEIKASNSCH